MYFHRGWHFVASQNANTNRVAKLSFHCPYGVVPAECRSFVDRWPILRQPVPNCHNFQCACALNQCRRPLNSVVGVRLRSIYAPSLTAVHRAPLHFATCANENRASDLPPYTIVNRVNWLVKPDTVNCCNRHHYPSMFRTHSATDSRLWNYARRQQHSMHFRCYRCRCSCHSHCLQWLQRCPNSAYSMWVNRLGRAIRLAMNRSDCADHCCLCVNCNRCLWPNSVAHEDHSNRSMQLAIDSDECRSFGPSDWRRLNCSNVDPNHLLSNRATLNQFQSTKIKICMQSNGELIKWWRATYSVNTRESYLWNLVWTPVRWPNNWIRGLDYWIELPQMLCHKMIIRYPLDRVNSSPNCSPNANWPNQAQTVTYLNGINLRAKNEFKINRIVCEAVFIFFLLNIGITWCHECNA